MSRNLLSVVDQHKEKLRLIKVFLTDVDGVLTDGRLYWAGEELGFGRFFNTADGYGLKIMMEGGLKVGVISGGNSPSFLERVRALQMDFIKFGNEDKRQGYLDILRESGCTDEEILYIGDEFFDIPLLKRAGFSAAPPHAPPEVLNVCDYTTTREGGMGCVREVVDLVRMAQGITPSIPDFE